MKQEQFTSIVAWQNETFRSSTAMNKLSHLCEEMIELIVAVKKKDPQRRLEFADCFILLMGAASADGMSYADICNAIDEKMEINKKRKWGIPDAFGVVRHIKET